MITIQDALLYTSMGLGFLGMGTFTYLFPIYYLLLLRKLDRHYLISKSAAHPMFPKSTLLRLMIYCSSIALHRFTMKGSLNFQYFDNDYPRSKCNTLQIFLAYYSVYTALFFCLSILIILIFDFIIAPLFDLSTIMN